MKVQILRESGKAGVGPELMRNPAPEGSRRVSPFLRSREGDFHQLTPMWTMHGVGHSQSMDATAFELSRWRDGCCGMGHPLALLAV